MKVIGNVLLLSLLLVPNLVLAQDAVAATQYGQIDVIMALSDKPEVTVGEALVQLTLLAGGQETTAEAARAFLAGKGIVEADLALDVRLSRGCLALIVMKTRGWGGGLMYSLVGGSRYAWRELIYRKIMPTGGSEHSKVSGGELLAVIGRAAGEVDLKMEY